MRRLWTVLFVLALGVLLSYAYGPDSLSRDISRLVDPVLHFVPDLVQKLFGS